ncbi:MAG TPA: amidase [Kaistia sp.]|nr:amidase [Kaistia sp.]
MTSAAPLWTLSAADLSAGFAAGAFTPVEALKSVLARLDHVNPSINAVIAIDSAGALAAAEQSAARWRAGAPRSTLDGVPITIKDNLHLRRLPATWGSRALADFVPDRDEPAVARLRSAGAVLFGKTNVPELTVQGYTSNLLFGTTFNPHAPGRTPGGSTGGGAAAVAAGIGPIAIGTDGGGSLRRPAAHCGLFALKPSVGMVPRYGGFPAILSDFEVIGAVARTADDLEMVRGILEGVDVEDPRSLATLGRLPSWPSPLRVAFMPTIGSNPVDPRIAAAAAGFAADLAASGADVVTVSEPFDFAGAGAAWATVMTAGVSWYLAGFPDKQDAFGPSVRQIAADGAKRSAPELLDALAAASEVRRAAGAFFRDFDILVAPATAALAWPADEVYPPVIAGQPVGPRGHAIFTGWMNVAGVPAVTVPLELTEAEGGIGVQLVAAHGRDADLVQMLRTHPALRRFSPAPIAKLD